MAWYDRLRNEGAGALEAMRQAVPLLGRAPHARPGDPAAERRTLEAPAAGWDGDAPGGVHEAGPGSGSAQQLEQRGYQIVKAMQARALTERGYSLSADELTTTLGATTTLPGDVIARLARADDLDRVSAVPSP